MAVSAEEARKELARRELVRRSEAKKGDLSSTLYGGFPALLDSIKRAPKTLAGVGELGLQAGSSAIAQPIAGVGGFMSGVAGGKPDTPDGFFGIPGIPSVASTSLFNNDKASGTIDRILGAGTYQPRTEMGQKISGGVGSALGKLDLSIDDALVGATDSPGSAAALKTMLLGVPEVLALKGGGRAAGSLSKPALRDVSSPSRQLPDTLPAPTVDELFKRGSAAFDKAREAGSIIEPGSAERLSASLGSLTEKSGLPVIINKKLHPESHQTMKEIQSALSDEVSFDSLMQARQLAADAAGSINKSDARIAMKIRDSLDDFVDSLDTKDMAGGDPKVAAASLKEARSLWARASNAEFFERLVQKANNDVATNYSQAGFETALRRRVKNVLNNDKQVKRFPAEIKKAMQEVVDGTPASNFLRLVGKAAPRGVVSGGFLLGATAVNPVLGAALYGAGELSKGLAQRSTIGRVNSLIDTAKRGSLLN